ncbi:MAG: 23S rRNA (uracil(1939)-C(5))-methyltransferase RlmD [Bacteroidales bacterium]|nr:23S rRNA (uracil(1939)-C(5))-methyltransferase RlmD [Bacteroidales bacterium]
MKRENWVIENLEIIDAGAEGKAVGKHKGLTVFVPYVIPGDIADVQVFKKKKGYLEAKLLKISKLSPYRIEPKCSHFGLCGGCKWQIMDYAQQLFFKQKQVKDNFQHLGKFEYPPIMPILASEKHYFYRNKLEFTFTNLRWLDNEDIARQNNGEIIDTEGLGFHIPGKFDKVLDIQQCYLQIDPSNAIRLSIKEFRIENTLPFYNIRTHEGLMRNLIIRTASSGEVMVIVVFTEASDKSLSLMRFLQTKFPSITSLYYVVNTKLNDSISDLTPILFHGTACITEMMETLQFKISPVSFFQTNSEQALQLYRVTREFAQIGKNDIVYDLYTGTGTIANFVAAQAKKVVGIEYVDAAIEDAKDNAQLNGIVNTRFFAGDMAKVFTKDFVETNGKPDIVITDPPRAGMHANVIEQLLTLKPKRIVYVSCNPATQVRDITLLSTHYRVVKIQPLDMFPHTHHVENIALLELQ